MIEVFFHEQDDVLKVMKSLHNKVSFHQACVDIKQDGNSIIMIDRSEDQQWIKRIIIPALTEFTIRSKEDEWLITYMRDIFYYEDQEEQRQILEIIHSIIDGEAKEIPYIEELTPREDLITYTLGELLSEGTVSFSFESFTQFRLKVYKERLMKYVEAAIDEYKLEQEYQNFIHNLRSLVDTREPKLSRIHIYHKGENSFIFYNHEFRELKRKDLIRLIDRDLIQQHPMYIDSLVIAPLLSISPTDIFIYTDQIDDGMVQTIQNIFQERVTIHNNRVFPSNIQEKNR